MKKTKIVILVITMAAINLCPNLLAAESVKISRLRCEYLKNPLGIEEVTPRVSWRLQSDQRGQKQEAYQILVASSTEKLNKDIGDLWDSGKVNSDQSV